MNNTRYLAWTCAWAHVVMAGRAGLATKHCTWRPYARKEGILESFLSWLDLAYVILFSIF